MISILSDVVLRDRRSLGSSRKPSGVLIGHTEGITYVSAKGDGRYVISNGKDQVLRLWDLRKMRSSLDHEAVEHKHYGISNFDYRFVATLSLYFLRCISYDVCSIGTDPIRDRGLRHIHKIVVSCSTQAMKS